MLKIIPTSFADFFQPDDKVTSNKNIRTYVFGIILLLLCGWKVYNGLQGVMDIQFADESAYMRFGLDMFGKFNKDWGPMYCIWYKCLSWITTDTIQLYYLNYALTSVLIGVLLYIFLLRISVAPMLALMVSFSILISDLNIAVWPRISHFCIALLLFFLIIITYIRQLTYKFLVFSLFCLIASYARPEFYISFLLTIIAAFISFLYNRNNFSSKDYLRFLSFFILFAALHYIFRFPSNDFFGYNRGVAAFYQHYAFNYKVRTHANIDSWLYWEEICKQQFGDCNSMWCVIKTQPMIVLSNTLFNIKNYFLSTLLNSYTYIFPVHLFQGRKIQLGIMLLLTVSISYLIFRKKSRSGFLQQAIKLKFYLFILLLFIAPTILSCVVVFPREHYVYLQMPFFLLVLTCLLQPVLERFSFRPIIVASFGLLLFLSTPNIKNYSFLKVNNDTPLLCNKELVKHLEKKYADKPHTLFTNMPFVRGMLPLNFHEINTIFDKKKRIPFRHYMDSAQIDIVILTPSTFRDPHILSDSTWTDFIQNYGQYHFRKEQFNDCETYLLVKEDAERL